MQAWRHVQPSGTNRPSSSRPTPSSRREVAGARSHVPHDVGFRASRSGMGRVRLTRRFRYAPARAPGARPRDLRGTAPGAASGHGGRDPPGPIPNPEVKPSIADGTAASGRGRAGRRWPHRGLFHALAGPACAGPFSFPGRGPARTRGPFSLLRPCARFPASRRLIDCRPSPYPDPARGSPRPFGAFRTAHIQLFLE